MGKFMETRFHELLIEHESWMWLLKTRFHTFGRRGAPVKYGPTPFELPQASAPAVSRATRPK